MKIQPNSMFFLVFLLLFLNACKCNTFSIDFFQLSFSGNIPNYKRIYGIGGKGDIDQSQFNKDYFKLPISAKSDTVTYIFEADNQTDTLTITYQKDYTYSRECGYLIRLKSFNYIKPTTFKNINQNGSTESFYWIRVVF